jgi:hypothetical protein
MQTTFSTRAIRRTGPQLLALAAVAAAGISFGRYVLPEESQTVTLAASDSSSVVDDAAARHRQAEWEFAVSEGTGSFLTTGGSDPESLDPAAKHRQMELEFGASQGMGSFGAEAATDSDPLGAAARHRQMEWEFAVREGTGSFSARPR